MKNGPLTLKESGVGFFVEFVNESAHEFAGAGPDVRPTGAPEEVSARFRSTKKTMQGPTKRALGSSVARAQEISRAAARGHRVRGDGGELAGRRGEPLDPRGPPKYFARAERRTPHGSLRDARTYKTAPSFGREGGSWEIDRRPFPDLRGVPTGKCRRRRIGVRGGRCGHRSRGHPERS